MGQEFTDTQNKDEWLTLVRFLIPYCHQQLEVTMQNWDKWEVFASMQVLAALSSVLCYCCCSVTQSCPAVCKPMDCSTLGFPVLHHLVELAQIHVHWVGDAIQPFIFCHPLLLLPSIFPSIRVFSIELALCIRWPKYWSFSFRTVLPMNIQGWFPLGLTTLISLKSKDSHESSPTS